MKTMISKFPGTCRDCGRGVGRGETIVYHGRGAGITCGRCAGLERDPDAHVAPCWECKAPEGKFRCYGAASPVYCDACEARIRPTTLDWKLRHQPVIDRFDMDVEDRMAESCGPGL